MKRVTLFGFSSIITILFGIGTAYANNANGFSVPEPATLALLVAGVAGMAGAMFIKRRKK